MSNEIKLAIAAVVATLLALLIFTAGYYYNAYVEEHAKVVTLSGIVKQHDDAWKKMIDEQNRREKETEAARKIADAAARDFQKKAQDILNAGRSTDNECNDLNSLFNLYIHSVRK